jgi:hypothetical protein
MLAVREVVPIGIEEMLATRRVPREAGVRLTTEFAPREARDYGAGVGVGLAPAPRNGDAVLVEAPVFRRSRGRGGARS